MTGTIKALRIDKGFGFITGEDRQQYFMHRSAIRDGALFEQLREGQSVAFDPTTSDKVPRAENVRVTG